MGKKPLKIIGTLVLFGMMSAVLYLASISFAERVLAPDIFSSTWINSDPLKMEELRGKVVMVEF